MRSETVNNDVGDGGLMVMDTHPSRPKHLLFDSYRNCNCAAKNFSLLPIEQRTTKTTDQFDLLRHDVQRYISLSFSAIVPVRDCYSW